ncbi:DEAD/DEAH box helicase [Simkania negevensis]|uniref:DEAD/DEAH box helicase n=1 Tax=Simkania negevensis TaxID=83561 RepID=A0ABS3AUW8_9BACT|nr:DEAD/DEAH box helicase [Simkania negevensis]
MISIIETNKELLLKRLEEIEKEKRELLGQLDAIQKETALPSPTTAIHQNSPSKEKIALFCSLFRGREDVFPKRWTNNKSGKSGYSPVCANEWKRGICQKPKVKCSNCLHQAFTPVSEQLIFAHLAGYSPTKTQRNSFYGESTMGVYPLLKDETCWFLAADFDKKSWQVDISAFLITCRKKNIPAYIERSRSGNGAHVWMFFTEPVNAKEARQLGAFLITETMKEYPEIGFDSYDRLFPNQDTMPSGGFGNLIALPLQSGPREKGNSVFIDEHFEPYPDQWKFLSEIQKVSPDQVREVVQNAQLQGEILGIQLPLEENEKPWQKASEKKRNAKTIQGSLPKSVSVVLSNQIFLEKKSLPSGLQNQILRLAAFQNPEFYKAQSMRLSTFGKPRIICCAEDLGKYFAIPKGCFEDLKQLFIDLEIALEVQDERESGKSLNTEFLGKLYPEQAKAVETLLQHDIGVLSATTAFGKTVVAASMIAQRKRSTLILVHRKQLLSQWKERLKAFLNEEKIKIGEIGGGKFKPSGEIDIAIIQSLSRKEHMEEILEKYGHVIVDECHHLSAVSFEAVTKTCRAKYVLGLTATPTRKDGHHPIIFMQCGPIRYRVDPKQQALARPFQHFIIPRMTPFQLPGHLASVEKPSIQDIYKALILDHQRNEMIFNDVLKALEEKRTPLFLTERKEHVEYFRNTFQPFVKNLIIFHGGLKTKERKEVEQHLQNLSDSEELLIISTGRYLGEGFDYARLDTLFLAMPVSWKGTLAQYAGRLHRLHQTKSEVVIFDYIDYEVPMLGRMWEKRLKGYTALGYETKTDSQNVTLEQPYP